MRSSRSRPGACPRPIFCTACMSPASAASKSASPSAGWPAESLYEEVTLRAEGGGEGNCGGIAGGGRAGQGNGVRTIEKFVRCRPCTACAEKKLKFARRRDRTESWQRLAALFTAARRQNPALWRNSSPFRRRGAPHDLRCKRPRSAAPCPASATTPTARSGVRHPPRAAKARVARARAGARGQAAHQRRAELRRARPARAAHRARRRRRPPRRAEILTDKLMQLERGVLQTTFDPHGGKSADLPSSGADGATAELCAPSLSVCPTSSPSSSGCRASATSRSAPSPRRPSPPTRGPTPPGPTPPRPTPPMWPPRRRRCDRRRGRGGLGGVVVDGGGAR